MIKIARGRPGRLQSGLWLGLRLVRGFFQNSMEQQEIFELVKRCLVEEFEIPAEKIRPESNLFETLGLDSIDALDMIALLESRMKIEINEQELKKMRTVQHIVDYLKAHLPHPAL